MPSGKQLRGEQRRERRMAFHINGDVATPTLLVGNPQATIARTGAGDYLLTFRNPYGRAPILIGSGAEDNAMVRMGTSTVSTMQVLIEDASTNLAADLDVVIDVIGWDSLDEI